MEIVKWRKTYETGIGLMDEQHNKLIPLVNQMYNILRNKEGMDELYAILQEMSDYAEQHLRDEENLLETHG